MTTFDGPGPQLAEMLRRLRARPASSWRHGNREHAMRSVLQLLADGAADAEELPRRALPDVGVMALGDQLAVLVADARAAGVSDASVDGLLVDLARDLSVRP